MHRAAFSSLCTGFCSHMKPEVKGVFLTLFSLDHSNSEDKCYCNQAIILLALMALTAQVSGKVIEKCSTGAHQAAGGTDGF